MKIMNIKNWKFVRLLFGASHFYCRLLIDGHILCTSNHYDYMKDVEIVYFFATRKIVKPEVMIDTQMFAMRSSTQV